jgi:hypothetical protein
MNVMIRTIRSLCLVAAIGHAHQSEAALSWSVSPDKVIPDNSPDLGTSSDIYIAPGDSQLAGMMNPSVASVVSIQFTITGGWDGDYTLVLCHADGTTSQSLTLLNLLGGGANASSGFNNVTLAVGNADINSAPSASGSAITGTWAPESGVNFNTFQNGSPAGDWMLYVTDNQSGDTGTLASWSLSLDVMPMDAVPEPVNVALVIFGGMAGILALARARWAKRPPDLRIKA